MPAMLDLCCGLGGASAAMRARGWSVTTVDIDAELHPSIVADVRKLTAVNCRIDLLWASPPCVEFSRWALPYPRVVKYRCEPDLSIVQAVRRLISEAQPRFWMVENVQASRKWLTPIFGQVRCRTAGHVLWGNVPLMVAQIPSHKTADWKRGHNNRLNHLRLAKIPFDLSEAVAVAVERALK